MKTKIELKPISLPKEVFSKLPLYKQEIITVWNIHVLKFRNEMEKRGVHKFYITLNDNSKKTES